MARSKHLNRLYQAESLARQARTYSQSGKLGSAISSYREAIEIQRAAAPGTEYEMLDELGLALLHSRNAAASVDCFRRACELLEHTYYPQYPKLAPILDHWCAALIEMGDLESAEQLCNRSLGIKKQSLLASDVSVLETYRTLAHIQRRLGKFQDAETNLLKALPIVAESTIGPVEEFQYELGLVYMDQGRLAEAETQLRSALQVFAVRAGKNKRFALCLAVYTQVLERQGKVYEAMILRDDAMAILSKKDSNHAIENNPAPLYFEPGLYPVTILH